MKQLPPVQRMVKQDDFDKLRLPAEKVITTHTQEGEYDVVLFQQNVNRFAVQYGAHFRRDQLYIHAAAEFGECILHQQACAGNFDNSGQAAKRRERLIKPNQA